MTLLSPAWLLNALLAAAASGGFAVFFNVPPRALAACAITGALAYLARLSLSVGGGVNAELATFVAATLAGIAGTLWGRRLRAPAVIFVIPGVIPLIPGQLAFRTMIDVLQLTAATAPAESDAVTRVVVGMLRTSITMIAMACGAAVPSLLLRPETPMT
jgi:uncharacterized membrane protein YjjB (DUF3815 family)